MLKMISKTIKFILSLCMMIGLLSPVPSFAAEEDEFLESSENEIYVIGEDESEELSHQRHSL